MIQQLFLSESDIERLTGKKRPSAQIRWLRHHGWRFEVNGLAKPIVASAEMMIRMSGGARAKSSEPNWGALNASET